MLINGSFIISFLFITGQIFKENEISPSANIHLRLMAGVIYGIFGSCLMLAAINVSDIIIVDIPSIALIIAAITGGGLSAFLAAIVMSIFRIGFFGLNNVSITAAIVMITLAAGFSVILKSDCSQKLKFWLMSAFSVLLSAYAFYILIDDKGMFLFITASYVLIFIVVTFFSYYVFMNIRQSNQLFRRYKEESRTDFLTGLYNHRQFGKMLASQLEIVKEGNEQLSILAIDIDHFKVVNDTYGHPDGDKVLQNLGLLLKKTTRKFDIVARCGGEEFSVLLLDCPRQRALEIAERIRAAVENEQFSISNGKVIHITVSIGVSAFPDTTKDAHFLQKQADNALYEAKHSGRNRVCLLGFI